MKDTEQLQEAQEQLVTVREFLENLKVKETTKDEVKPDPAVKTEDQVKEDPKPETDVKPEEKPEDKPEAGASPDKKEH